MVKDSTKFEYGINWEFEGTSTHTLVRLAGHLWATFGQGLWILGLWFCKERLNFAIDNLKSGEEVGGLVLGL